MAVGAKYTLTGTYRSLGLFYQQAGGAGSLVIKRGVTTLSTISAAGAGENDKFTGIIDTGSDVADTYSFEVTGAPVEVTGLIRFGVKVAGSQPRAVVSRCAHGSYVFLNFNSTRRASMIKQAAYAGGKCVPMIMCGINDSFGTAPATFVASAEALVDDFIAQGVPEIFAFVPIRPTAAWDATYTGGRTYPAAMGPLVNMYRRKKVTMIGMPIDFNGEGFFSDGLHPNGNGNDAIAQRALEGMMNAPFVVL